MKLRLFGSKECHRCRIITSALTLLSIPLDFVDANADETQDFCDEHDVDALPHVQLLDDKGDVVWQKSQTVTLEEILRQKKHHEAKRPAGKGSKSL